ncbi:hypothetical protein [Sansalvadorimonas verongulae]|uniref:hypothetical protein n=1 Tax=Sansalvadorimonas verongulae TaxID=2172824 RepID=UPI0012BBCCA4|nr:hypothetical protein [Sansalvadorimonas verongulae]MTI12777.1 hypothetical protein [Sansalvadorimonas verongulae]
MERTPPKSSGNQAKPRVSRYHSAPESKLKRTAAFDLSVTAEKPADIKKQVGPSADGYQGPSTETISIPGANASSKGMSLSCSAVFGVTFFEEGDFNRKDIEKRQGRKLLESKYKCSASDLPESPTERHTEPRAINPRTKDGTPCPRSPLSDTDAMLMHGEIEGLETAKPPQDLEITAPPPENEKKEEILLSLSDDEDVFNDDDVFIVGELEGLDITESPQNQETTTTPTSVFSGHLSFSPKKPGH